MGKGHLAGSLGNSLSTGDGNSLRSVGTTQFRHRLGVVVPKLSGHIAAFVSGASGVLVKASGALAQSSGQGRQLEESTSISGPIDAESLFLVWFSG